MGLVLDKESLKYQSNIKTALENPTLTEEQKQSLGNALAKENIRKIYDLNLSKVYRDKIYEIEKKSNFKVEFQDFAKAGLEVKYQNDKIIVTEKYFLNYYLRANSLFMSLAILMISFISFFIYLVGSFFNVYGLIDPSFTDVDMVIMFYTPFYVAWGFTLRDKYQSITSLTKIIDYGKQNPNDIEFQPMKFKRIDKIISWIDYRKGIEIKRVSQKLIDFI